MSLTAVRAFLLFIISFSLSVFAYAAPGNDNCSGAVALTLGVTNSTGTVKAATASTGVTTGCATGSPDDDVWYSFTLPSSRAVTTITLSTIGLNLSSSGAMLQLFSGTCTSLVSLKCGTATITATNLASGTYYIRVYSAGTSGLNSNAGFSIIVLTSPDNDECSAAASLTSNTSCTNTTGILTLATASSGIPAGCAAAGTHYDMWYKFVAAGSTETITLSSITNITSHDLQLYSGTCGALTSLQCTTANTLNATGLSTGTTYYLRVSSIGTDPSASGTTYSFNICITHPAPPPANDDCSGATTLVADAASTSGTVWGATTSSGIPVGCATGTSDDDVWYKFAANGGSATITLSAIGTDLNASGARIQLFSGTCGALTSVACGTTSLTTLEVTAGTTYYVRVYSNGAGSIGTTAAGSAFSIAVTGPPTVAAGRLGEVFQQVTLSGANLLLDPWEITYGSDGNLWITEAKGYKLYKMNPNTGVKTTVLDIANKSTFLLPGDTTFNVQFTTAQSPWPQGGFAGLAIHPKFLDPLTPKNYIYVSYVYKYNGTAANTAGIFYTNRLVRFTYNTTTNKLESPVSLCDTLPGSSDHNSQRMIIAPVNGTDYLFYAEGDMGAGQFDNLNRQNKAQITASYEGKILRFNLEDDGDAGGTLDKWIPNNNPFNGTTQSAVWSTGIRNNQGFAYAKINGIGYLYGSSHGPFSDDEINIIEGAKNYGHPLVIGFSADGNYNNSKAGSPSGSLPLITSETDNAAAIGATYRDAIFSFYPASQATINNIYLTNPANSGWPSEAPSGMDIYTNTAIPGWKNSLLTGLLKGGRVMRLKLNTAGTAITATDTVSYFRSVNRFRDIALTPDGKTVFAIIDKSSSTSGPTSTNPIVSACPGCVIKYTFIGYQNNTTNNKSTIPTNIAVTTGVANSCNTATGITIDASNNNVWVPITGPDGNIMAEIKANGNNLGTVSSSFYSNTDVIRKDAAGKPYLDRNMTITPQVQPSTPVSIRLYLTAGELNALKNAAGSGVTDITSLSIFKNSDACGSSIRTAPLTITPIYKEVFGSSGYVLQANINSFSSFYFGNASLITLPLQFITFKGALQKNDVALQWETANEKNTAYFIIERSADGIAFEKAGILNAGGNRSTNVTYAYLDSGAALLPPAVLYYRLKTIDADGKFSYSSVVTIRLQHDFTVMVFPNPVNDKVTVRINNRDAKEVTVQVSDVQGRVIYSNRQALSQSINNLTIDVRRWKPQLYIIKIVNSKNEVLAMQKFEKL